MKIYNSSGKLVLDAPCEDSSFRHRVIMGDHNLTLKYSLAVHVEIPVGSYCDFEGLRYTLKRPENLKMKHSREFEYTVLFESPQADTKIWKMRNTVDGRLKFPLTAKPHEHLEMLVANLNRRGSGWTVGDCIDGAEHLINYDHDYCWDALGKMAQEFNTEFEINNKRVSLKKVEYNKDNPLALSYGKGNGFRSGIARTSEGSMPVEFLFVQGGTRNIDRSKYGSSTLLLPKNQTLEYNGRKYRVDDKGLSIYRIDKSPSTYAEDSLSLEDIYPSREGKVSELITVNADGHLYDFTDTSIPDSLDFSACQIEGEKMTVVFQSGMLAGHGEFEVSYFHAKKGDKKARRFEIVPKDEDGYTMPDATFKPKAGDTYIVLNIMLPDSYIADNDTQTGAEWDMFREAVRYMYDHEESEFSFTGELDPLWAKQDWVNIGGKIILGGYVSFTDSRFQQSAVLVRITGVKDYINKPHKPEIELSNQPVSPSFMSELKTIEAQEVQIDDSHRDALSFTKRRFRDAKETMDMLNELLDAGFDNFTNNITPISIQTMQLLVGDESLQYRFVTNKTSPATKAHNVTYDTANRQLKAPSGILQHLTLGINTLSNTHKVSEYKFWDISAFTSAKLTDGTKKYYLYVRVLRDGTTGEFLLSETAINMYSDSSYYYLLYGILNSEYEDTRSFVSLYGFTEVLPGRVTTDRVISGDGNSYFDMLNNAMRLGATGQSWGLDFNSNGDGKLRIKGTIVQSESGDEQPLGVFRGWWNKDYVYYYGDEVLYNVNGFTATYRCISLTPISGSDKAPTNTTYWQLSASGQKGSFKSRVFCRCNNTPNTPSSEVSGNYNTYNYPIPPAGKDNKGLNVTWYDGVPKGSAVLWSSVCTFYGDGTNGGWSTPAPETDSDTLDIEFSPSATQPAAPSGSTPYTDHESEGWYDPNSANFSKVGTMIWRAERKVSNGVYDGEWVISRIYGEKGDTGQSSYPSTMFVRMNDTPAKPTGGSFTNPSPSGCLAGKNSDGTNVYWSDGIPDGTNKLWASSRIFTSDGKSPQQAAWSTPRQQTDTSTYDVEFATMQTDDGTPATPSDDNRHKDASPYGYTGQVWFDPDKDQYSAAGVKRDFKSMYWRAERYCYNGVWTAWVIIRIKGEKGNTGASGNYVEERYCVNGSTTDYPPISQTSRNPTSDSSYVWQTAQPSVGKLQYLWMTRATINGSTGALVGSWSTPIRWTPIDGTQGEKGDSPAAPFRGIYSASKVYVGTKYRVDVVKFSGHYYVARTDVGEFSNQPPMHVKDGSYVRNSDYWNDFGAEFSSVATEFLLAEFANIAGWIFKDNTLISQLGTVNGVSSDDIEGDDDYVPYEDDDFIPNITLDAVNGVIKAGDSIQIDNRGVSLYDSQKNVVAQLVNTAVSGIIDLTKESDSVSGTKSESRSIYIPYQNARFNATVSTNYDLMGYMPKGSKITIGNASFSYTLPPPSNGSGSYYYYTPIYMEARLICSGRTVKIWKGAIAGSFSQNTAVSGSITIGETLTIDGTTYKEGVYSIYYCLTIPMMRTGTAYSTSASKTISVTRSYSYNKSSFKKTLIGNDGLFSCWGTNNYIHSCASGFTVRTGSYMFRVTSSGIQKSVNGGDTWTSL